MTTVKVQHEDFDLGAEVAALRRADAGIGAVACFVGTVRDVSGGDAVTALELEHYPGMTEKLLLAIVDDAKRRWPIADAVVIHRCGRLLPADQIVLVAVAAAHRAAAFSACEFIVDYLKTDAPFWKKETTLDGDRWVEARDEDEAARARWAPMA